MSASLAIVGNCQVGGLQKAMDLLSGAVRAKAFFMSALQGADRSQALAELREFDAVYAQPGDDPVFGAAALREAGFPVREFPVIAFSAYHPDMVYAQVRGRTGLEILQSPVGDNHSALILYGHHIGLNASQIANLFGEAGYRTVAFHDVWKDAWHELSATGDRSGFDLRPMMLSWSRRGPFMHTLNHPKAFVLADLAREIAVRENLTVRDLPAADFLIDDLMTSTIWPVYPEIAALYGVQGACVFKKAMSTTYYDLPEMIERSLEIYDRVGRDEIHCWRFGLWDFLPGLRDNLLAIGRGA